MIVSNRNAHIAGCGGRGCGCGWCVREWAGTLQAASARAGTIEAGTLVHHLPCQRRLTIRVKLGWSDFEEKNVSLSMLCQIVVGPQFQNFTF